MPNPKRATTRKPPTAAEKLQVLTLDDARAWEKWLAKFHVRSPGVWLRFRRKSTGMATLTYRDALEVALCYGWIDGQSKREDATWWRQKFTPRRARSIWSKLNQERVAALIAAGRMQAAGFAEIERAKQDGRWAAAYESPRRAVVPADLQAALQETPEAQTFFKTLDSRNRYAILFRIHQAKKADTRAKRIAAFIEMLQRRQKFHP